MKFQNPYEIFKRVDCNFITIAADYFSCLCFLELVKRINQQEQFTIHYVKMSETSVRRSFVSRKNFYLTGFQGKE